MSFICRLVVVALALMGVAYVVPGIGVTSFWMALLAAGILALLNVLIRPILVLLTLPITIVTLGLFIWVINALLFWLAASFLEGFTVAGFVPAFVGALIVSCVGTIASKLL